MLLEIIKMIEEYDRVILKDSGITGIVVDIGKGWPGEAIYAVESDEKINGTWEIFYTNIKNIEKIEDDH